MLSVRRLSTVAQRLPLTKIVATIGPASEQMPMLGFVADAGLRVMRINFSHATYEEADLRTRNLRSCPGVDAKLKSNLRAIMLDTQGPEIRTGSNADGVKELHLVAGEKIVLTVDSDFEKKQTSKKLWISYRDLLKSVKPGMKVMLDDGKVEIIVEEIIPNSNEVVGVISNSGHIGNKRGVNIPGGSITLPAMSVKDKADIKWGVQNDIDFIAASFIRKASDVTDIRDYTAQLMREAQRPVGYPLPKIISKIESTEGMANFEEILAVSDGIMVARGDLGVEIPIEEIASAQKNIVLRCNSVGKPVVVATQMLDSMEKNPRPTRAEVTDVYNAVLDGADLVMLSGESAKGKYPVQSIATMNRIVLEAEKWVNSTRGQDGVDGLLSRRRFTPPAHSDISLGTAYGVIKGSQQFNAACIINLAKSGTTATQLARFRPDVPIVTFVPYAKTGRQLQMYRAIHPVVMRGVDLTSSSPLSANARVDKAVEHAVSLGYCKSGDNVIVVFAERDTSVVSKAASTRVVTVV